MGGQPVGRPGVAADVPSTEEPSAVPSTEGHPHLFRASAGASLSDPGFSQGGGPAPAPLPSQRVRPRNRGRGSLRSSRHGDVYALCRPFRAGTWFGHVFPGLRPGLYYGAPLGLIPSCGAALTGRSKVALPARPEGNAQGIPTVTTIGALSERHHPVPREYGRPPLSPLQRDLSIKTVIRTLPPKYSRTPFCDGFSTLLGLSPDSPRAEGSISRFGTTHLGTRKPVISPWEVRQVWLRPECRRVTQLEGEMPRENLHRIDPVLGEVARRPVNETYFWIMFPKDLKFGLEGAKAFAASVRSLFTKSRSSLTWSCCRNVPAPSAARQLRIVMPLPWFRAIAALSSFVRGCLPWNASMTTLLNCSQ